MMPGARGIGGWKWWFNKERIEVRRHLHRRMSLHRGRWRIFYAGGSLMARCGK
jgi:hypothetical protein